MILADRLVGRKWRDEHSSLYGKPFEMQGMVFAGSTWQLDFPSCSVLFVVWGPPRPMVAGTEPVPLCRVHAHRAPDGYSQKQSVSGMPSLVVVHT